MLDHRLPTRTPMLWASVVLFVAAMLTTVATRSLFAENPRPWIIGAWEGVHQGVRQDLTRFELIEEGNQITWRMRRTGIFSGAPGFVEGSGIATPVLDSAVELEGVITASNFSTIVGYRLRYSLTRSGDSLEGEAIGKNTLHVSLKKVTGSAPPTTPPSRLLQAAKDGDRVSLDSALAEGTSANEQGAGGETALHWASAYGHRAIAESLLAKGADVDARDGGASTPLHYAAEENQGDVIRLLVAKGATVDAKNANGMTPLHLAAARGHRLAVDLLLTHHARIDAQDNAGSTPLHLASSYGRTDVIPVLLKAGADPMVKDADGLTALELASANDHADVAVLLRSAAGRNDRR